MCTRGAQKKPPGMLGWGHWRHGQISRDPCWLPRAQQRRGIHSGDPVPPGCGPQGGQRGGVRHPFPVLSRLDWGDVALRGAGVGSCRLDVCLGRPVPAVNPEERPREPPSPHGPCLCPCEGLRARVPSTPTPGLPLTSLRGWAPPPCLGVNEGIAALGSPSLGFGSCPRPAVQITGFQRPSGSPGAYFRPGAPLSPPAPPSRPGPLVLKLRLERGDLGCAPWGGAGPAQAAPVPTTTSFGVWPLELGQMTPTRPWHSPPGPAHNMGGAPLACGAQLGV